MLLFQYLFSPLCWQGSQHQATGKAVVIGEDLVGHREVGIRNSREDVSLLGHRVELNFAVQHRLDVVVQEVHHVDIL